MTSIQSMLGRETGLIFQLPEVGNMEVNGHLISFEHSCGLGYGESSTIGLEFSLFGPAELIPSSYDEYMEQFRKGDIWRCKHCQSENPKRAKLRSFEPEQEITHCLSCAAPRHVAYG